MNALICLAIISTVPGRFPPVITLPEVGTLSFTWLKRGQIVREIERYYAPMLPFNQIGTKLLFWDSNGSKYGLTRHKLIGLSKISSPNEALEYARFCSSAEFSDNTYPPITAPHELVPMSPPKSASLDRRLYDSPERDPRRAYIAGCPIWLVDSGWFNKYHCQTPTVKASGSSWIVKRSMYQEGCICSIKETVSPDGAYSSSLTTSRQPSPGDMAKVLFFLNLQ